MQSLKIAIDGPAGAGKSTVAKILAKKLGIEYIDTGAMYRAFTLKVINNNLDTKNIKDILKLLKETNINFANNHIYLDGNIVDEEIRQNIVNNNVSKIAKIPDVRKRLVEIQRNIAKNKSVIMDGRDIGTHVLTNANFKFFITASVQERAKRRFKELLKIDNTITLEEVEEKIILRDKIDSTRKISPLKASEDAIIIDTTNKTIEDVVNIMINIIKGK